MGILAVIKREFLLLKNEPKLLLFIFGAPILFTLLFGALYSNNVVKNIPLVIYDGSQTQLSQNLIQGFEDSEKYKIVGYLSSQEEMEKYLQERKAIAALVIPQDFNQKIKKGLSSEALILVNSTNMIYANSVTSSASEIIQTFSGGVSLKYLESLGQMPEAATDKAAPVQMRVRLLYNPTLNYTNFMLLGLLTAVLQQAILLTAALSMIKERKRLAESQGHSSWLIILGKSVPYWLLGTLCFWLIFTLGQQLFGVTFRGSYSALFLLSLVFVFSITYLGMLFSTLCPDELTATQYAMLYAIPSFLYSGYTWPLDSMNSFCRFLANFFPLRYVVVDLRDLALSGYSPTLWPNLTVLLGAGLACYLLTTILFSQQRRKAQQKEEVA